MIYNHQTATCFAWYHAVFLFRNCPYMSAVNNGIAIGTSLRLAEAMLYKCRQEQGNACEHK